VRRLVLLVVGLVVAMLILDFAARAFVAARVESEFRDSDRLQADGVDFTIDSFPFLARLGLRGEVSATLRLEDVEEQGVTVDEFEFEVDGMRFDRDRAFRGEILVTGVDQATATVSFDEETVSDLLGVPVAFGDGTGQAGGVDIEATMAGDDLVVSAPGVGEATVPLTLRRYLPCDPEVAFRPGLVDLTCSTDRLPPIVNQVIGQAVSRS
jgi:hypothetical protein